MFIYLNKIKKVIIDTNAFHFIDIFFPVTAPIYIYAAWLSVCILYSSKRLNQSGQNWKYKMDAKRPKSLVS